MHIFILNQRQLHKTSVQNEGFMFKSLSKKDLLLVFLFSLHICCS